MPNILANVELSTAQSAPVTWADVLGLSAVVDVKSADSIILLLATIPLKSSSGVEIAEFRFAVGGVREGPFSQGQHELASGVGSADISTFAYALTGLSGSQTFSVQWQEVLNTLTLNTAKVRNFQVIELLPGDRLDLLGTAYDRTSGIESAAGYVDVQDLDLTVPVVDTDSVILLAGTLPIGQGTGSDRVASGRLADGGVDEGGESIFYSDTTNKGTGLSTLMRVKSAISGMHTFSLQWKTEAGLAGQISLFRERALQALEFRPAVFPVVEATATSVSSSSLSTHTIDTPAGVVSGDLLIAMISLENITSPGSQFSGWSDGFIEIKDKTTGGTAGVSIGMAYKFSDGTEGANITVDTVDTERAAHAMYRISGHNPSIAPEVSTGASGVSAAPDPDSLSPAGGAKDYLWMVVCGFEQNSPIQTVDTFPTNYGSNQVNVSIFSGGLVAAATREASVATEDPGVFGLSGSDTWQAFTLAVHPFEASVALTGTATATIEENDILDGGKTIILTLTDDTWVAAGGAFDAIRQDIIDGMVSSTISGTGFRFWNDEVTPNEVVGAVVRTSDTVVTITLTAQPLYNIFSVDPAIIQETITVTVPASALVGSTVAIPASPDFTVDQSPVSVEITGTLDGSDETDIVAGGRTMLLTLRQASWTSMWGATQAQLIIDGLNSAQSEGTGWNAEVRDKMPVTDVVRTSNTLLTITLSAQAGYDITAPEVITATIPNSVLTGGPGFDFDATPDQDIAVGPAAADLSGTITPASTEAQIVAGGRTLLITLDNDTWVASGAAFNGARQAIIDGITSAQSEVLGWNNEVRDNLPVGQVTRTSDTVVTITFVPETGYNITDFEEITVTVPASALLGSASPVVATPTFVIFEVPVALVTGTAVPEVDEVDVVAGGETIILTLIDDEWVAAGATFNAVRQAIIDGLDSAGAELLGWNNEVRDNLPVTAVVRTSATVVTITLTAQAGYDITINETITVTVPGAALDQTPNDITGVPTFTVKKEAGSHMRSRRGGRHAEDLFDVNEPDVETFEVNKFE